MKRALFSTAIILAASLTFCQRAAAGTDREFSVAASFGSYPVPNQITLAKSYALRYGLEIGYQISGRLRVSGEVQYAYWSQYNRADDTETGDFNWSKASYSSTPILLSLIYVVPIDKTFTFFLGAGAGYHPFTLKARNVIHSGGVDVLDSQNKYDGHGIFPHISLGLETVLSKRISVFGQVRELIGVYQYKVTQGTTVSKTRANSAGLELLAGVRIYI